MVSGPSMNRFGPRRGHRRGVAERERSRATPSTRSRRWRRHETALVPAQVKSISKTQVVACMNPGAGSFFINPRLQRWFVTFEIGSPQRASLNVIYDTFLNGHLSRGFADEVLALKDSVIKGAMNLHGEVMQKFRKTAANFHYEFNIRSVTQRP